MAEAPAHSFYPNEEPFFNSRTESNQACGWLRKEKAALPSHQVRPQASVTQKRGLTQAQCPPRPHFPISDLQLQNFLKLSETGKPTESSLESGPSRIQVFPLFSKWGNASVGRCAFVISPRSYKCFGQELEPSYLTPCLYCSRKMDK